MNKLRYRVIFSAARGMLVAVQETARSAGKAAGTTVGAVGVTAAALLALTPAQAQIAADPNAPGNQRPTVLAAPNGVPVVNIVTPSAAGVSRNVYRQFDVNAQGAILNNSRTAVQSQLGGYIGANPWLASGSARVILNEVNSSSPSYLRGYVEVAGPKAEVIIANPSGIQVQGGGFINVSRATLTTGVPQLNAYGGIESYRVSGGSIDVSGSGLDASGTEFAALYARMVSINAGVWGGGELRVVTGANQVSADGAPGVAANVVPMAGSGPTPPIAFDSGALGGMYAQKIWIMGTEAGVGARNAGTIQTGAGDGRLMGLGELTVTASGRIENIGMIQAAGAAVITAPTFVNSGTVVAAGTTKIATQGDLANAGGTIEGRRIELASAAGDVNNAGTIRQTSMVGLALAAPTLVNTNGGTIGYEPAADASGAGAGGGSSGGNSGAGAGTGDAGAGSGTGGPADPGAGAGGTAVTPVAPIAPGLITAAGTIRNDGGHVYAGGPIELQTPNVSNAGGKLEVSSLAVSGPTFSNAGGTLHVANGFSANVVSFENSGGKLNAGSLDITTTGDLLNQDGTLASNGNANLQVGGMVKNQRGTISATGALDARVAGAIQNVSGSLLANQAVSIQGRSLDNTLGTVASAMAGTSLSVTDALTNSGQIGAATDLVARAGSLSNTGSLRAGNDASIVVAGALIHDGSITAGRNVVVSAATLQGGRTGVLGAGINADGSPGTTGDLNVTATGGLVAQGKNLAAGQATLQGASVDLSGSQTGAANIAINATQGDVTTSGATVATAGTLSIRADSQGAQTLVNQGGKLNAGQLDLHASNIANTGGGEIVQTGAGATTIAVSGSLSNAGGRIASNGQDLALQAVTFANAGGSIEHAGNGTLSLRGGSFEGAGGSVVSNGALVVGLSGAFNQDGGKLSAQQVTIDAASIGNRGGEIVQIGGGATHIAASGVLDNTSGTIASNGADLGLAATTLVNKDGTIQHAGTGTLSIDAQAFQGAGGRIASNGALAVHAGEFNQAGGELTARQITIDAVDIDNRNAKITQLGDGATRLAASGRFDNTDGQIATNGHDLSLLGGSFLNTRGAIAHAGTGTLALDAGSFDGNAGSIVSNGSLVVQAGDFSQDGGSMAAQQIRIDAASLSNRSGTIVQSGNGSTHIAVTATVDNTRGRIATNGQDLALRAATLQNSAGAIEHAGAGTSNLDVGTYSATQGRVISNGALAVRAGTYAQDGGATIAQQITIDAADIANIHGAEIVQVGTAATHIAATGTLKNDGGRIASNGADMTLKAGALSNALGHLQHAGTGTMTIDAGNFAGAGGEITSNGALVVRAGDFNQAGGVTTAAQVTIDAAALGNRGGRIIQTGAGATRITVAGAIDNSAGGTIASNGDVSIAAGSLLNQGGTLRAAGASGLDLATTGLVDNGNGGEIGAGGNLALSAGSLRNDAGRITAVGNLVATVVGAASNVEGTLAANGDAAVTAGSLDNTRGIVAAVEGALRVTTSGTTVNAGGTMQAGGDVVLASRGFDNTAGKVFGDTLSVNTDGNTLSNAQGTLAAATTVALNSGALANDAGLIQSGGAMTVNTNGQALSNTNAAGHASGKGGITSAGTLDIASGALSNAGGYIGSKDALTANSTDFSNTSGGTVFSQSSVAVDTHGATYDNTGGVTQAVGDLSVNAGTVRNAGGLIRSGATTTLTAGVIDNTHTQGIDQGIEGRNVALNVGDLDNTSGAVRSDVNTTITSGGSVNNTNGLISANDTLRIVDPKAANPNAKTLAITNTGGVLTANKALQLDAARFSADGTVSSGRDLSIALTQDIVNNGEVSANGELRYVTTGNLTNNGKLLAGGTLTAGGNVVENTVNAEMSAVDTIIQAGTLNNRGLIDSHGQTRIDAGTVNNIGTGRIYGDAVAIGAGTLNNVAETVGGATSAATIAARSTLDIGAGSINNRDGALIFSAGDMYIGGALDANGYASGKGSVLNNESATIESLGDMSIAMANVNNIDTHLQVVQETRTEQTTHLSTLDGKNWSKDDTRGDPFTGQVWHRNADGSETLVGISYLDWQITETTTRDVATHTAAARLAAGGNMDIDGHLLNRDSKVTAGGSLTATSVDNRATQGQSATSYSGMATGYDGHGVAFYPLTPYSDPAKTIDIGSFEYTPNTHATAGYNPGPASSVNGPGGSAGQAGSVSGGNGPGTVIEVASAVSGSSRADGEQAASQTGGVGQAGGSNAATAGGSGAGTAGGSAAAGATGAGAGNGVTGARDIPMVVRTSAPDTRVPSASLFQTKPGAGNYLVETDLRFANYRNWLNSDYLLNAMGFDANSVQKRLGDGFYEQKLIREQVAQLTGYFYLDGYTSDEEQYTALMNAGVTFAQKYHLTPGIALTAEQMAQLTSDIVWLVEQTVTLPDGSTQRVLVPQVYVRVQPGDIDGSGALLSAERTIIKNKPGEGDFTNSGTIAGRQLVSITADNVNNLGGRISGGNVALDARADINVIGGTVDARDSLALTAGNDINVRTTTSSTQGVLSSATSIDRIAGLYVSNPGGILVASAGNDVNVIGGILANTGEGSRTLVNAGRDINLGTVTESSARTAITDSRNFYTESRSQEIGSQIVGGGNVTLSATNDINARAAGVAAQGTLAVIAGNDVNISEGRATSSTGFASHQEKKSTFSKSTSTQVSAESTNTSVGSSFSGADVVVSAGNDIAIRGSNVTAQDQLSLSAGRDVRIESAQDHASSSDFAASSKKGFSASFESGISFASGSGNRMQAGSSTTQVGSTVSGGNVSIDAGRDVQVIASNVLADKSIALTAGRNIDILAAQDTQSSGMAGSQPNKGVGIVPGLAPRQTAYSNVRGSEDGTGESSTAVTSLLSANGGNLTMVAGLDSKYVGTGQGNITTEGADLLAKNKVTLSGNAVNLNAATSSGSSTHSAEAKSHTVGAALSGTVGSVITRAYDMAKEAGHTEDSRLKGALELKAGYDAYKLATDGALQNGIQGLGAAGTNGDPAGSAFGVSISEQRSKQRSMSAEAFTQQRGTNIQAGSIDITARETDINMQGAKLQAQDISLDAKRDINLLAAQNTAATGSNSSGRSMGGGVTFGFGSQNGISFQGNIGSNQGKANGSEVRYDNTLVTATGSLKVKSGNDTNLIGAQLAGESVKLDVGGNLNIETLQDQTNYASKQTSSGLDVSICVPPICYGEFVTGTVSTSREKVDHNYQSATGQSGIAAGKGGFDVTVKGNTDLKGGAITSTATEDKNSLVTGSLTTSDLENRQNTNSSSQSLSLSYSSGGNAYSQGTSLGANAARSASNMALSNLNSGKGLPGDNSQSSQTQSVISPGNIKITGTGNKEIDDKSNANVATLTSRDAETANGALVNTLTLQQAKEIPRLQQEAQDRQRAAQLVGSVIDRTIGDVAAKQGWAEGSTEKIVLHGLAGIVQAKIGDGSALAGAAAGAINEALLPQLEAYLQSQGYQPGTAEYASLLTAGSTMLGAAVGAATGDAGLGSMVATNATVNNRLLHNDEKARLAQMQEGKSPEEQQRLADAACALVHCSYGINPNDPGYADAVMSQARGADYAAEQKALRNSGMFGYSMGDMSLDTARSLGYATLDELQSAMRGAAGLKNAVKEDFQNTVATLNPPQLPPDYPGGDGPNMSGGAGAVVTPPTMVCTPAGCVITPPVVVPIGSPGYVPDNSTLATGGGGNDRLPIKEPTVADNGLKVESNPKHTPGMPGSQPNAGTEPSNSLDLFNSSVAGRGRTRYAIDADGNINRFSEDGNGVYHWSGSTGDKVPLDTSKIPISVKRELGYKGR